MLNNQLSRRGGRSIWKRDAVESFPIFGWHHFDCVPRAAIEEGAIRSLARALLAADTKIRIDFDAAKGWMILIRYPKHAGFDRAIFDAGRRSGTAGTAIRGYREDPGLLFTTCFAVSLGHRPMFVYNVVHAESFY